MKPEMRSTLNNRLFKLLILTYPDATNPFVLIVDAIGAAVGAAWMQEKDSGM